MAWHAVFPAQAELLCSEMQGIASFQLAEAVQPLRDVAESMKGLLGRVGSFLERAEVALQRLPLSSTPIADFATGFVDQEVAELFGSFSPHAGISSTPPVVPALEGGAFTKVVAPVLQIMPELQVLCGEPISPPLMEQLKVSSLQASDVAVVPSPPPVESCRASASLPLRHHGEQSFRCCCPLLTCDHRESDACE